MTLYLGCPIWAYKGWVSDFFPTGTKAANFLLEYARRLNTVEGNTTFYAVPSPDALRRWVQDTPESFRFCPKIPRTVSHAGVLAPHIPEAGRFLETMRLLGNRLGPMFLQLPARYSPASYDDLREFLDAWPPSAALAVEVRHPAWFDLPHQQALNGLLAGHGAGRVVIDTRPIRGLQGDKILEGSVYQRLLQARQRKPDAPVFYARTADFVFIRYIGHPEMQHNAAFLDEWVEHLSAWLKEGVSAYVFCHCPDEGLDPWLCREFYRRLSERLPLAPLPWDAAESDSARQARLF
jgi:uncharacterized protein YecE (DUF72 family)